MLLSELIGPLKEKRLFGSDTEITGITYDSRQVSPGLLFVAFHGGTYDGHDFIKDAISRGSAAVVAEKDVEATVPVVRVPDSRAALPALSAKFYDYPSRKMTLIGVTGTNGKTTATHLIHGIFQAAGRKAGLIGTLGARIGDRLIETEHTTPEASDLQAVLARMADEGVEVAAMEVSSHALVQGRSDYCEFDCGVFTNLTQDHLDFHKTFDEYLKAKLTLFSDYPTQSSKHFVAAVNLDDPSGRIVVGSAKGGVVTYGIKSTADVTGSNIEVSASGVSFVISHDGRQKKVRVPVGGYFSAYNGLAAAAAGIALGIDLDTIAWGLEAAPKVPGRFESVNYAQEFGVIVDYAHTPDGLENVLRTARELAEKRLITVFGCGGNRDSGKRPLMGKIASDIADVVIVTSDNPRKEDPEAIIQDILKGIPDGVKPEIFIDRKEAITRAITMAEKGDVVVIAGKGHEDYQIFADRTIHFDDREVALEILREKAAR